jgi:tetratricopeptide (TPR) repeat protein
MWVLYITLHAALLHADIAASAPDPAFARPNTGDLSGPTPVQELAAEDPDALYARRADLGSARRAADIWAARLKADPKDFESAWKLARACYWIGRVEPKAEQRARLEQGMEAGRQAVALDPSRPDGHFWLATTTGTFAETQGIRAGLKYRKTVREHYELAAKIDPSYEQGGPDRALGRYYYRVPGLFGGSNQKSEQHLRRSLEYDPDNPASLYFLAETLLDLDRKAEARAALQKVVDAPVDPAAPPEEEEYRELARKLWQRIKS